MTEIEFILANAKSIVRSAEARGLVSFPKRPTHPVRLFLKKHRITWAHKNGRRLHMVPGRPRPTWKEIASQIGCPPSLCLMWYQGKRKPRPENWKKFERMLILLKENGEPRQRTKCGKP